MNFHYEFFKIAEILLICDYIFVACSQNHYKISRYHISEWSGKRWQCCKAVARSAAGCENTSSWLPSSISSFDEFIAEDTSLSSVGELIYGINGKVRVYSWFYAIFLFFSRLLDSEGVTSSGIV